MTVPFMRAYTELLVQTCHRRGAHAIGGMAAFIPSRRDPEVNERALAEVRDDKERESGDGFDGTWVAHPDLVPVAREVFDARPRRRGPTRRTGCAPRSASPPPTSSTSRFPAATSPRPACAPTSRSASPTSPRGWPATAPRPSTTSWRTPPPPRSAARSCGSGASTASPARRRPPLTAGPIRHHPRRGARHASRRPLPDSPWTDAAALLDDLVLSDDFAEFLTLGAYRKLRASTAGETSSPTEGVGDWARC